ncbi:unnamed protein product [Blepharisma stoltei]|uniref:Uncharacterized protein n=1 Tax=Blepharisma stoltei TaxID=1481888 RepID=A0AAU9I8F1_9CILI|nr:unnamed protein product [Blepharisma stoltei]
MPIRISASIVLNMELFCKSINKCTFANLYCFNNFIFSIPLWHIQWMLLRLETFFNFRYFYYDIVGKKSQQSNVIIQAEITVKVIIQENNINKKNHLRTLVNIIL